MSPGKVLHLVIEDIPKQLKDLLLVSLKSEVLEGLVDGQPEPSFIQNVLHAE